MSLLTQLSSSQVGRGGVVAVPTHLFLALRRWATAITMRMNLPSQYKYYKGWSQKSQELFLLNL